MKAHFNRIFSPGLCASAVLFFLLIHSSFAQKTQKDSTDNDQSTQDLLESNTERDDTKELDIENVVDLDGYLKKHPIDLNKATADDLQPLVELEIITDIQKDNILNYRAQLGNFISIYELEAVPYLDVATIKTLLPYVNVTSDLTSYQQSIGDLLTKGDYMVLAREQRYLETQKGFLPPADSTASHYLGNPYGLYARFKYSFGTRLSYGFTAQKDAGEEFFTGTQKRGFDFYSAHFYLKGNKFLKALALGDYTLNFGQGLIAASGFGVGKSSQVMNIKYGGRTLRPYTSVNEFSFFRGAAVVLGNNKIQFTPFFSYNKTDGNVTATDTVSDEIIVSSFGGDGLHRTASELADRHTLSQTVFGGNLDAHLGSWNVGATGIQTQLSAPVSKSYQPYNEFDFQGNQLSDGAVHFDWQHNNFLVFGEGAMSDNGGIAALSGILMSVDPHVDVAVLARDYQKDFQSLYANAFSESTLPQNEQGIYTSISIRPVQQWKIDAYADFYRFPWLNYLVSAPSTGTDYLAQVTYTPNKVLAMYARWKDETKGANSAVNDEPLDFVIDARKQNLRFNLTYKATRSVSLRSRAEWVFYKEENADAKNGFLIYQDVIWKQLRSPVQLTGRFCLFDADTYDARIYAYEDDVLYAYSIPAFNNRGIRFYLLARVTPFRGMDVWLRYAQTYYTNIDVIGSGLDEIDGNTRSEVKAEVRFRF